MPHTQWVQQQATAYQAWKEEQQQKHNMPQQNVAHDKQSSSAISSVSPISSSPLKSEGRVHASDADIILLTNALEANIVNDSHHLGSSQQSSEFASTFPPQLSPLHHVPEIHHRNPTHCWFITDTQQQDRLSIGRYETECLREFYRVACNTSSSSHSPIYISQKL